MRESEIEKYLCDRVKAEGGIALKFVSPGRVGVPDRAILMPGGVVQFVEVKNEDGPLSEAQIREFERYAKLGVRVEVIRSFADADAVMTKIGCIL